MHIFKDTMSCKQFVQNVLCVITCGNNLFSWNLSHRDFFFFSNLPPLPLFIIFSPTIVWNISLHWPLLQYKTVYLLSKRVIFPQIPKSPPLKLMRMWFPSLLLGPAVLNTYSKSLSWIHVWLVQPIQIQHSPVPLLLCHNMGNLHVPL